MSLPAASFADFRPPAASPAAALGRPERIWAIGSLHGRHGGLCQLHEMLIRRLRPFERVVYLGNYLGPHSHWTGEGLALIGELVAFRNAIIAIPGFFARDVVFLRGKMEAMVQDLPRLAFLPDAREWAEKALADGLECALGPYGFGPGDLQTATGDRISANRFASEWRRRLAAQPGHLPFFENQFAAARSEGPHPLAFVPEGFDPRRPLNLQREALTRPLPGGPPPKAWPPYARVIRGAGGENTGKKGFLLTLDDGKPLDGMIHATCLDAQGGVVEMVSF